MQTLNLDAICLKAYPYSETSKVAIYWTREQGDCRAMVKGVRKANSKLASACETLTRMTLTVRPGQNLAQVQQVSSVQGFPGIRRSLVRISAAAMLAEWLLCNRLDPQASDLFDWLLDGLQQLDSVDTPHQNAQVLSRIVGEAQTRLIVLTGQPLQLTHCLQCDASFADYPEVVYFAAAWGGAICPLCYHREPPAIGLAGMSPGTLHVLNNPCNETWVSVDPIRLQKFWLFLARNWWHQPLPAHEFWLQQLISDV